MKSQACPLSARHREILSLAAQGLSRHQIAEALATSPNTVKNQLLLVYGRLSVSNCTAAVAVALREGWIDFPPKETHL